MNALQCSFCGKNYSNKDSLKVHIHNRHVNEKAFQCQVCPKAFSTTSNLKNHVRTVHLMERPYECVDCGKSYASEGGLSAHQAQWHHGLKNKYFEILNFSLIYFLGSFQVEIH